MQTILTTGIAPWTLPAFKGTVSSQYYESYFKNIHTRKFSYKILTQLSMIRKKIQA